MTDLEKEIFANKKLIKLLKQHYKKISKIKKDNIKEFIDKYENELKEISEKRNWRVWLLSKKKIYLEAKKKKDEGEDEGEDEGGDEGTGTGLPLKNKKDSSDDS